LEENVMWLLVVDEGLETRVYEHECESRAREDYEFEIAQAKNENMDRRVYLTEVKEIKYFEKE
jgi:hypothetical protein